MKITTEFARVLLVAAVPAALVASFPFESLSFKVNADMSDAAPECAFVTLSASEELSAMSKARSAWATSMANLRTVELDLISIPEEDEVEELLPYKQSEERETADRSVRSPEPNYLVETLAAGEPKVIVPSKNEVKQNKFDLQLKID